jgi:hypothetical protein
MQPIVLRSDFDKYVVITNAERRGWVVDDTDPQDAFSPQGWHL